MTELKNVEAKKRLAETANNVVAALNNLITEANNLFLTVTVSQNPQMGSKNSAVNIFITETISYP